MFYRTFFFFKQKTVFWFDLKSAEHLIDEELYAIFCQEAFDFGEIGEHVRHHQIAKTEERLSLFP